MTGSSIYSTGGDSAVTIYSFSKEALVYTMVSIATSGTLLGDILEHMSKKPHLNSEELHY